MANTPAQVYKFLKHHRRFNPGYTYMQAEVDLAKVMRLEAQYTEEREAREAAEARKTEIAAKVAATMTAYGF